MTTPPPLNYQSPPPGNPLKPPAILLLIAGSLTLLCIALDLLSRIVHGFSAGSVTNATFTFGIHIGPPETAIAFNALSALLTSIMLVGSVQMLKLRRYPLALTAAILAIIPFTASCCCFFTLPVGIWALVLLNKPEIKSAFL